ncbi:hypothetical protein PYW07_002877 [Mythimna separata]|uniref:Chitin-binding type-2 domain-containing protein n=1 Tax=Mythimna separata TaxID=271217 RepID=A0AAD8DPU8_MYTSE|nr:hypothetical protein PYW07_002877 [Mythimna separata]
MKGIIILLFTVCAAVVHAQNTILVEECPKDQAEDWTIELLLRHEYCNKFYMCTLGKPVEYECPSDLWFNLETQQCDWRENVDCTDRYVPDETPTTTLIPETEDAEPTWITDGTTLEPTLPPSIPPSTTSTTTTTSTTPEPTTTTTTTTAPEPTTTTTTTTTPAPTTTTSTTTTAAPTTTTSTTTTTKQPISFLPNGCPTNPLIHWLLPHETDCNAFYYCVWGSLVETRCPATLHFNRDIQVCDWPRDAGCPATLNKHLGSKQQMR